MDPRQTPLDKLRHDIRGRMNGLKLCATALDCLDSPEETLEFLGHIETAADEVAALMDEWETSQDPLTKT